MLSEDRWLLAGVMDGGRHSTDMLVVARLWCTFGEKSEDPDDEAAADVSLRHVADASKGLPRRCSPTLWGRRARNKQKRCCRHADGGAQSRKRRFTVDSALPSKSDLRHEDDCPANGSFAL